MKCTSLHQEHQNWNGKLIEFGGWELPVSYKGHGILKEHQNVRENVGVFDVSHMGEIEITGSDAVRFGDWLVPNDVNGLVNGHACYTMLCREDGTIVDDLLVYRISDEKLFLVVNASNKDKDFNWIAEKHSEKKMDVVIEDKSDEYSQIAVQGPRAAVLIDDISDLDPDSIGFYCFRYGMISGIRCLVSRTGYTGEDGFEIYLANDSAPEVWKILLEKGKKYNCLPAGLGARDTLRLEGKLLLYGNDIDDTKTPVEARLMWTVKKNKDEFCGKDAILARKKEGVKEYLAGFEMKDRGIARHGYRIFDDENNQIGTVTSGAKSPTLGKSIGLGYFRKGKHKSGRDIFIEIRGKMHPAVIVKTPFYKKPPLSVVNE